MELFLAFAIFFSGSLEVKKELTLFWGSAIRHTRLRGLVGGLDGK
jgi:hypothetical protein